VSPSVFSEDDKSTGNIMLLRRKLKEDRIEEILPAPIIEIDKITIFSFMYRAEDQI